MQEERRPLMVTINEAAVRTGLSPYTVRKLCWQGRIVTLKSGKRWLINYESLIRFLEKGGEID